MPAPPSRLSTPSVTVIVLNYNGEASSRGVPRPRSAAQDYPTMTVMVADNGSTDRVPGLRAVAVSSGA